MNSDVEHTCSDSKTELKKSWVTKNEHLERRLMFKLTGICGRHFAPTVPVEVEHFGCQLSCSSPRRCIHSSLPWGTYDSLWWVGEKLCIAQWNASLNLNIIVSNLLPLNYCKIVGGTLRLGKGKGRNSLIRPVCNTAAPSLEVEMLGLELPDPRCFRA